MGKSLTTLTLLARQAADMENDPLVDDTEIAVYINDGLRKLYLEYINVYTDAYLTMQAFTVTAGNVTAPLPANFLRGRGVDYLYNSRYRPLRVYTWRERGTYHSGRRAHRIDTVIRLDPEYLDMSGSYRLWYYPTAPVLVAGSDALDAQMDLWSDYIVDYSASRMLAKAKLYDQATAKLEFAGSVLEDMRAQAPRRDSEPEQAPDADSDAFTALDDWNL